MWQSRSTQYKIYGGVVFSKASLACAGLDRWCTFSEQEIQIFYWQNRWSWWNVVSMECCHVHDMPRLHSSQQWVETLTNAKKTFPDSFQSSLSLDEWIGMLRLHRAHAHAVRPCVLPCMWTSASPAILIKFLKQSAAFKRKACKRIQEALFNQGRLILPAC